MIYKFKITSSEVKDFVREIEIGHEQTFLDFHNAIQKSIDYDNSQMASFYQINTDGERGLEVALFEMNTEEDDNMNVYAMDVAMIREFATKKQAHLVYVFDFFSDRFFDIQLTEKGIAKSNAKYPICTHSEGDAPSQILMDVENFEGMDFEGLETKKEKTADDYLADFDDEFDNGPELENLDDYEDLI